jgi:hypothetical protein
MGTMSVQAQFVSIDITAWTNVNIRTWTNGSQYPTGNRTLNVGGIPMYVTILNNDPNSLGVISLPGDGTLHAWDIPANVSGATALYTLMNNAWGVCGRNLGTIEVFGQNGSYASLTLIEGFNIRDHYNGGYCNTLTDPTAFAFTFGSVRLDRQKLELPASFATDIITRIRFSGVGRRPDGAAFLASLTLQGCEVSNGDVNQDGCVDDTDLAAVIFAFGQEGPGMPEDMDCNAIIDDADLATVIFHFGEGC